MPLKSAYASVKIGAQLEKVAAQVVLGSARVSRRAGKLISSQFPETHLAACTRAKAHLSAGCF